MSELVSAAPMEKRHSKRICPVRRLPTAIACRTSVRASLIISPSPATRAT